MKITEQQWILSEKRVGVRTISGRDAVCTVNPQLPQAEREQIARLLCAAPALLKHLEIMTEALETLHNRNRDSLEDQTLDDELCRLDIYMDMYEARDLLRQVTGNPKVTP